MKVDNTTLASAVCPAKFKIRMIQHLVPIKAKPALAFGGALHRGWAEWYRTGSEAKALKAIHDSWADVMPTEDFHTEGYALKVLHEYVQTYPEETWHVIQGPSGPVVEQAFTLATGLFLDCQSEACAWPHSGIPLTLPSEERCARCGADLEPVLYGGIIDLGAEFSGKIYVVDHKTTTRLGKDNSDYYFNHFKPDNQLTGYVWAASKLTNMEVGGAIINAVGLYKSGEVRFKRQITGRNAFEINEWLEGVRSKCNEIKRWERSGVYRFETTQCITKFGECEYRSVHVLSDPISREKRLEQDYIKSEWDYEARDE